METQKIVNLLNSSENEYSKFATKNGMSLTVKKTGAYSHENSIKSIESNLCDYSGAYVLVTGNIAVVGAGNDTRVVFKNCAPFRKCRTNKRDFY